MQLIGFIGLGIMGKPMARNLLRSECPVMVYDISPSPVAELAELGAVPAMSPCDVAEKCGIIFTMLPDSSHVETVMLGENGIASGAAAGTIVVDCSSINPHISRQVAQRLQQQGIHMLDAPVSGGEPKAIDGTLAFMVGGENDTLQAVRPYLEKMGGSIVLCGGNGAGCITKLTNQIIVAANIMVASEAMVFAQKCGVQPSTAFEAIRGGLAGSVVLETKVPMMLEGNFAPGGILKNQIKDAKNVLECGHVAGAPLPITSMVMEMMQWLSANGHDMEDHSTMVQYYENLAGVKVQNPKT